MKHLYIKQNNNVEIVSLDIIEKLYQISQGGLYSTSDLIGNLQCTHAYDDAVTYLTTKFKNLQINVTDGSYIRFADNAVRQICATNWGDGTGITLVQASMITSFGNKFAQNSSIKSFMECSKFVNVKMDFNDTNFSGSSIESIDLSKVTKVGTLGNYYPYLFQDCTALKTVVFSNTTESIGSFTFTDCSSFNSKLPESIKYLGHCAVENTAYSYDVNLPNLIDITADKTNVPGDLLYWLMDGWFTGTNIQRVTNLGSITRISGNSDNYAKGCFEHCSKLKYVTLPATLQTIGCRTFYGDSALIYIRCLATTAPTIQSSLWVDNTNSTFKIYVPDDAVSVYKSAAYWSNYASRIFSLTQFAIDFPNG